jgi:tetratricopeptide (TPR) repeat protein
MRLYWPWIAWPTGLAYAGSGRVADAVSLLTQAVEYSVAMHNWGGHALFVATLGEALLYAGQYDTAQAHAEQALALARRYKERGHEAWSLRLLGEIAARRDRPHEAEAVAAYHQAMALAEALGLRPLVAHCHLGLGTLYLALRQPAQARSHLSAAVALYRALDLPSWLARAEALAARHGSAH